MSDETKAPEDKSDVVTVSQDNLDAFNAERLGLTEPVVEEAVAEPIEEVAEVQAEEEVEEEVKTEEKPKKKNSVQERISEITGEKKAAQEEAARERAESIRLRQELDELRKKSEPQPEPEVVVDDGKPKQEDYKEWADYVEALSDWKVDQKFKVREQQLEEQKAKNDWQDKVNAAKAEIPDYDEVLSTSDMVLPNAVLAAIKESDIGPKIAHHLAANPDVAEKLSKLTITAQVKEIGKLESSLTKPPAPEKPAVQVSKAPAPVTPIKGTTTFENKVDTDGNFHGTPDEFKALRKAGKIK